MPKGQKEGNVLFNDALNTFYFTVIWRRTHGKGPLSERGNPLPPHGLLFPISSKGSFICTTPQTEYNDLCHTSCGALAGTRNSSMGVSDPSHHEQMLYDGRRKEVYYLMTHSTHFIYCCLASARQCVIKQTITCLLNSFYHRCQIM